MLRSHRHSRTPSVIPAPLSVIPAPLSVTPAPPTVIPAQAGTHASTHPHIPYPVPNSSLPPTRGEVRWGVGGSERPPASEWPPALFESALTLPPCRAPTVTPTPLSVIPAHLFVIPVPFPSHLRPPPSFLRRQEPTHPRTHTSPTPSPIHPSPPTRGEVRWGVEASEPAPPSCTPIAFLSFPRPKPSHLRPASSFPYPFRHTCAPHRHSCAGRNPRIHAPTPPLPRSQFIPPPYQGGG